MTAPETVTIRQAAHQLGIGERKLFDLLRSKKIIYKDRITDANLPYPQYVKAGYLKAKNSSWTHPTTKKETISTKTMVTTRGLLWLQELIENKSSGQAA